jgi:hypothetical protein
MVFINDVQYLELKSNELTTSTYLCCNDVYDGDALWWLPLTTVCVCSSVLSRYPPKPSIPGILLSNNVQMIIG